jgi:hypothetical protein
MLNMKKLICFIGVLFLFAQCANSIKNENAVVSQEKGTELVVDTFKKVKAESLQNNNAETNDTVVLEEKKLCGFWVGYFLPDLEEEESGRKNVYYGEGRSWRRENKINISIDKIEEEKVIGHTVVAGNDRPFKGTIKKENGIFYFEVKEPGDNKYDGVFTFQIKDNLLGIWKAFQNIDISKRKYKLERRVFNYDPNIMLENNTRFVDWKKNADDIPNKSKNNKNEEDEGPDPSEGSYYASATALIFKINASNKLLTKKEVENLKKGDLLIIRNTIYARHGYSFKNRQLRVFFDAQSWYIPVYADIKSEFTEIEKQNIKLLLRYEKNAQEYYDGFGRG